MFASVAVERRCAVPKNDRGARGARTGVRHVRFPRVRVLVAEGPLRTELGELPAEVELVSEPDDGVEFVVLGVELMRRLPGLIAALPALRVVQTVFAGADMILPIAPPGVVVCTATGAHDIGVSEWVVMMILALSRRLDEFLDIQRTGQWERNFNSLTATGPSPIGSLADLHGATVLILGHGSIGRAVAARLEPFGAHIIGVGRRERDALPDLVPAADVIVVLLPLTPQTEQIVDAAFLARCRPGALLVNAGRGRCVDTDALVAALHEGRVRAALDVTDPEPLPEGHALWSAPGVLITPHVAGGVPRWQARAYRIAGDQIRRVLAREPLINVAGVGA
jgi:phosphoglycerate dehydrogenase-like enzyme